MVEPDRPNDADQRPTSRRGGAPWPPPGADAWWTQDGGTRAAQPPTSIAPPERPAPDIPAPSIAPEAAAESAPAVEDGSNDGGTENPTARVTRRRTRRPTDRDNGGPTGPKRRRPAAESPEPRAVAAVEESTGTEVIDESAPDPIDVGAAGGEDEPAAIEGTPPLAVVEPESISASADQALPPVDEATPVDESSIAEAPIVEAPIVEAPIVESPVVESEMTEPPLAETMLAESAARPMAEPAGAEPNAMTAEDTTSGEAIAAEESISAEDVAFPITATIVADGDFVEEPEFAVPDLDAPPPTRRNPPETGFPLRAAPPVRPPDRRQPVRAAAAPPLPVRRRIRPAPVPVQVPAYGDSLDDFDFFSGEADQMPAALTPVRRPEPIRTGRPHRHRKRPRRPALGLPLLLLFALAAAFFAWVSATPLLLTAGHGSRGVATVATCSVHGIDRSCAEFVAADKSFSAAVTLLGPASTHAKAGQKIDAQMVSRGSSLAYAGNKGDLLLHWVPGVVLLVLCGFGVAWATGALRLTGRRTRSLALLGSFGGPFLLFAGMLAYAW
jgi:hypothetical protein